MLNWAFFAFETGLVIFYLIGLCSYIYLCEQTNECGNQNELHLCVFSFRFFSFERPFNFVHSKLSKTKLMIIVELLQALYTIHLIRLSITSTEAECETFGRWHSQLTQVLLFSFFFQNILVYCLIGSKTKAFMANAKYGAAMMFTIEKKDYGRVYYSCLSKQSFASIPIQIDTSAAFFI